MSPICLCYSIWQSSWSWTCLRWSTWWSVSLRSKKRRRWGRSSVATAWRENSRYEWATFHEDTKFSVKAKPIFAFCLCPLPFTVLSFHMKCLAGQSHQELVRWPEVPGVFCLAGLAEPPHAVPWRAHQSPGYRDYWRIGGSYQRVWWRHDAS